MKINFNKNNDGLVPAIVQDATTNNVLMLGYMNENAVRKTIDTKLVTFFSRSKQRLWTKGEESGNILNLINITLDCDNDALLIKANPNGPTCHKGTRSCFPEETVKGYIYQLEDTISKRIDNDVQESYTNKLFKSGINKVAQKVGEEVIELVIEAKDENNTLFKNEAADLLYHYLILLKAKGCTLETIEEVLKSREK